MKLAWLSVSAAQLCFICDSPVKKSNIIQSCITIASLHSKHSISELPLRVSLICVDMSDIDACTQCV